MLQCDGQKTTTNNNKSEDLPTYGIHELLQCVYWNLTHSRCIPLFLPVLMIHTFYYFHMESCEWHCRNHHPAFCYCLLKRVNIRVMESGTTLYKNTTIIPARIATLAVIEGHTLSGTTFFEACIFLHTVLRCPPIPRDED